MTKTIDHYEVAKRVESLVQDLLDYSHVSRLARRDECLELQSLLYYWENRHVIKKTIESHELYAEGKIILNEYKGETYMGMPSADLSSAFKEGD